MALEGADVAVAKPDLCTIYVSPGHGQHLGVSSFYVFLFRALAIRILVSRVLESGPVHSESSTSLKNPKAHSIRTNTLQGDRGGDLGFEVSDVEKFCSKNRILMCSESVDLSSEIFSICGNFTCRS